MTFNRLNENVPVVIPDTVILTYISFEVIAAFRTTPPKFPLFAAPTVDIPLVTIMF